MAQNNIYLIMKKVAKINPSKEMKELRLKISDICDVACNDKRIEDAAKHLQITVMDVSGKKHVRTLVNLVDVINIIEGNIEGVSVNPIGENQTLVDYEIKAADRRWLNYILTAFTCAFAFLGSMYVIMAYNNDVDTAGIFEQVYNILGISENSGSNIIEISYGIGLALGIIVFYNHFGKLRISDAPTPIQVEMDKYIKDEEDTLISKLSDMKEGGSDVA